MKISTLFSKYFSPHKYELDSVVVMFLKKKKYFFLSVCMKKKVNKSILKNAKYAKQLLKIHLFLSLTAGIQNPTLAFYFYRLHSFLFNSNYYIFSFNYAIKILIKVKRFFFFGKVIVPLEVLKK